MFASVRNTKVRFQSYSFTDTENVKGTCTPKASVHFNFLTKVTAFQVVIFVKSVQRCVALAQLLTEQNFPAIAIHRGMTQEERLSRYQQFKDFQKVGSR